MRAWVRVANFVFECNQDTQLLLGNSVQCLSNGVHVRLHRYRIIEDTFR